MWLRVLEVWLTARLLSSPTFHRAVRRIHKKIHEVRHGEKFYDSSELGGTKIDKQSGSDTQKFFQLYLEELKDQFRGTTKK